MSQPQRPLLMRANRLMGAALVERNLVKIEELEQANERLLQIVDASPPRQCTVLGVLAYEMKALKEEDVVQYLVEQEGLGVIDLRGYEVGEESLKGLDLAACWATWSVPFDKVDGFHFIASAYWLSPAVRTFWEKQLDGPILWFATTLEGIADFIEKRESAAPKPVAN
ncbi:MAG: hypothetical protein R3F03_08480 [Opitutaceae bacterium]